MLLVLKQSIEALSKLLALAGGLLILCIGCILFYEVLLRASGYPTKWIPEWSIYLFAWAILFGGAYTLKQGKHVRVELLTMHLPPFFRNILDVFTSLMGVAICVLLALHGWEHLDDAVLTGETTSTALRVPLWLTDFPLFLGFALLALQFFLVATDRVVEEILRRRFTSQPGQSRNDQSPPSSTKGAAS